MLCYSFAFTYIHLRSLPIPAQIYILLPTISNSIILYSLAFTLHFIPNAYTCSSGVSIIPLSQAWDNTHNIFNPNLATTHAKKPPCN